MTSIKMKGGVDTPSMQELNLSDLNVSGQSNISEGSMDLEQQSFDNPDYSGDTTLDTNGLSIGQDQTLNFGDIDEINSIGEENDFNMGDLDLSGDDSPNTTMDNSLGGKRRSKRRTNKRKSKKTKKTKKSKKSKKTKKTKKTRKRRQCGGGFTTSIDTVLDNDEQEYKDYKNLMSKQ
jgi:hypothetical protein